MLKGMVLAKLQMVRGGGKRERARDEKEDKLYVGMEGQYEAGEQKNMDREGRALAAGTEDARTQHIFLAETR